MRYDNERVSGQYEGHVAAPAILAVNTVIRKAASSRQGGALDNGMGDDKVVTPDCVGDDQPKPDASFERIRQRLRAKLGADVYNSWFGRLKLESATRSVARMSVPTAFLRSWITSHYINDLTALWMEECPEILQVEIVVRSATKHAPRPAGETKKTPSAGAKTGAQAVSRSVFSPDRAKPARPAGVAELNTSGKLIGSPIDPHYTFENFIEGKSNRVGLAAAKAAADQGANAARFNPLFIYASVGLGKTHLLQAIANGGARRANRRKRVVYLTAEYFMWRFASAIRDNNALMLKETLHDIDLLIIDDMQFLQGKKIQSEFCHLINTLLDSARQVVVAADRPPHELESLDARVRSRLQGGVALEIGAPDYDMRLAMLKQRLENAKKDDLTLEIKRRGARSRGAQERHVELPRTGRRVQPARFPPFLRTGPVDRPRRRHSRPSRACRGHRARSSIEDIQRAVSQPLQRVAQRTCCRTGARARSSSRARSPCTWPRS